MEIVFVGNSGEVEHRSDSRTCFFQRLEIADVSLRDFVVADRFPRLQVDQAYGEVLTEQRDGLGSGASAGAGDEESFAGLVWHWKGSYPSPRIAGRAFSSRGPTSIDENVCAGDETGFFGAEVYGELAH